MFSGAIARPVLRRLGWVAAVLTMLAATGWVLRMLVVGVLMPYLLRAQLSDIVGGEVACVKVVTACGARVAVTLEDVRVTSRLTRGSVVVARCTGIHIVFGWIPLMACVLHPSRVLSAAEKMVVTAPEVEWDGKGWPAMRAALDDWQDGLPEWPRFLSLTGGTARIVLGPGVILELKSIRGGLDLRDLGHIAADLAFSHSSGAEMSIAGSLHTWLKAFRGEVEVNGLELERFARGMAALGVHLPGGLAGRLKARITGTGGFQTPEEFADWEIKASMEIAGPRAAAVRRIISGELRKVRNVGIQDLPPTRPGGALRMKVDLNTRAGSR